MKDLKEIILERRVQKWEIEGKKVPQLYIDVFNSYLEEIAEELADHDKQIRKEVVQEIREQVKNLINKDFKLCNHEYANGYCFGLQYDLAKILDQIEGGDNGKID